MIIEELELNPFGGVREALYRFGPGLNVLLGPNEAGKSTLINALFAVLFLPPDVRKNSRDWKELLERSLPHPGGDTARVKLRYRGAGEKSCSYSCSWGEVREVRLLLESGIEINNPAEARERLLQALSYGRGTYQAVLFARQDEMERTLERLRDDDEAVQTVAGILRRTVIEAGGVSLEELDKAIAEASKDLLSNWDLERDGPRNNRGLDNPFKREVGRLLGAYYESEGLRRQLQQVKVLEKRVDDLAGELETTAQREAGEAGRLDRMKLLEKDIRRRMTLEPRLEKVEMRAAVLKTVLIDWPKTEGRVGELAKILEKDREKLAALQKELAGAGEQQAARRKRELLEKAGPLHRRINENERELSALAAVGRDDLCDLEKWQKQADQCRTRVEAMKLQARLTTRKPLELKITSGLEQSESRRIEQEGLFAGAGRLILESGDWTLEVQSGEGDVESLLGEIKSAEQSVEEKLRLLAAPDIAAAKNAFDKRERLRQERKGLEARLKDLLGTIDFAVLEEEVSALPEEKEVRDPREIQKDITSLSASTAVDGNRVLQERRKIEGWAGEYGALEKLAGQLGELEREAGKLTAELGGLAPPPKGYTSAEQFIGALEEVRGLKENLQEKTGSLKLELVRISSELPAECSEELEDAFLSSREKLDRLKEEARALTVVEAEFRALKEELDGETYEPLARSFGRYLGPVTGGRYSAAGMVGILPGSIVRAAGGELPVELLSTGTAGGVALALRLAAAEYLLADAAGFMVMDDPLVYLDPERKAQAAAVLQEFAREKQLLITTCDPVTADLLGGNIVEL